MLATPPETFPFSIQCSFGGNARRQVRIFKTYSNNILKLHAANGLIFSMPTIDVENFARRMWSFPAKGCLALASSSRAAGALTMPHLKRLLGDAAVSFSTAEAHGGGRGD